MNKALIIHPDRVQRVALRQSLEPVTGMEFMEFDNDQGAGEWLGKTSQPIDFIFSPWELNEDKKQQLTRLRSFSAASSALLFLVNSRQDLDWLSTIFHARGILEAIHQRPFRITNFIRSVQQLLTVDLLSKPCALVAEDEPEIRQVLTGYLKEFGFSKVLEAASGTEALETLDKRAEEISIVLSDWHMPGMNGIDLLKRIRVTPRYRRMPFVMITTKTPTEQIKTIQAAEMGVNGYLLKPFNLKSFRAQMESVVNETSRSRRAEAYLIAGRALTAQGNPRSEETLSEGLKLFPQDPGLWEALGDSHCLAWRDVKAVAQAAEAYEQALKLSPLNTPLVMKCFEVYTLLGRMNDAVRILKGQFHRTEHDDGFFTRLGKVYLQNGDFESAAREFRKAIAANPTNTEAQDLFQAALAQEQERAKQKAS